MPSMTVDGMSKSRGLTRLFPADLAPAAHIPGIFGDRLERDARHVGIPIRLVVEGRRAVADRVHDRANAPIEPRPAAEAPNHRNRDTARHGGAGNRPRVPEVQHRRACGLERLRLAHESCRLLAPAACPLPTD